LAEGLAAFPQTTMLSDRRAAIEGIGLTFEEGLEREAEIGENSIATGAKGATRFAGGEGRGAAGTGV
jgi:enoyl-CoA hydratase